jgi:hypothetical protein
MGALHAVLSVSPAWEAVEITLGDRLRLPVRGPRPYRFGSDNRGCSRTNAWLFSTFPRHRLPVFQSKASTVQSALPGPHAGWQQRGAASDARRADMDAKGMCLARILLTPLGMRLATLSLCKESEKAVNI